MRLPETLSRLGVDLELPPPDVDMTSAADEHLDPALRHHRATDRATFDNPVVELSVAVWNNGDVTVEAVDPIVRAAADRGWLCPPVETEALDTARAKVVELTERLRKRSRARKAAAARRADEGR